MSILSRPPVADALARVFARVVRPAPKPGVRFPDIEGDRSDDVVVTRHGPTPVTIYRPPASGTIYRPRADTTDRPAVYVNVHGGGFVVGHPEQDDPWCRYLAAHAGVVVVNVDYVLAPGHRFPAAAEQLLDVVRWAADPDRDWDGARLCVGGQSAGGNLSAAVSRMALEQHGPAIALQVLHYAPLDLVTPTAEKASPLGGRAVLKPWMGEVFDTAYIPDPARPQAPARVAGMGNQRRRHRRDRTRPGHHHRIRPATRRGRAVRGEAGRGRSAGPPPRRHRRRPRLQRHERQHRGDPLHVRPHRLRGAHRDGTASAVNPAH